eukprot:CAMPEP_0116892704 /NCGR_PEP_ID=MMETSP0467-20121206/2868_1 /TAXON_ID=283647 /ORGANISM="Mesodinium pulex, Strain SPMC105" /LENGTH=60 /DNA_ID=CAMNT_0004561981 /DNA_START=20 /DNA_END=198 /DNA_ORIENTATION=+
MVDLSPRPVRRATRAPHDTSRRHFQFGDKCCQRFSEVRRVETSLRRLNLNSRRRLSGYSA